MSDLQIFVASITAVGVAAGAWITGRYSLSKARLEREAAPYADLASRLAVVEARVDRLESEQKVDRAYIHRAAPWISVHARYATYPPPGPPDWYANGDTAND